MGGGSEWEVGVSGEFGVSEGVRDGSEGVRDGSE